MPFVPGQISSESWVEGGVMTKKSFRANEPIFPESIKIDKNTTTISLLDGESISVIINGLKTHLKK